MRLSIVACLLFPFLFVLSLSGCESRQGIVDQKEDSSGEDTKPELIDKRGVERKNPIYIKPEQQRWSFSPKEDVFSKESRLDLSFLNQPIGSAESRVVLSEDKNSFSRSEGTGIRFWPVNIEIGLLSIEEIEARVRFLAKRGVNMLRLHTALNPKARNANINEVDQDVLEKTFRLAAAAKKYGVYLTFSPYWGPAVTREGWGKAIDDKWPVPRNPEAKNAAGLLFFDPILQAAYKGWLRQLLMTVNPYTGVALADDPVFAILQLQNEDSLLFWSFNALAGEDLDTLRLQYGDWLQSLDGSLDATRLRWKGALAEGSSAKDDWAKGLISFANIWHMTRDNVRDGLAVRLKDQTQFLVETMKNFNREIIHYIRKDLGSKVLINPGNWKTASAQYLDDLERYSYSDGDVMAVNRYFSSRHEGPSVGWAIVNGQKYTDASVLLDPMSLPVSVKQPEGYPFVVSESNWVPPISFQAEAPFLVSVVQSINGVDGFYWFTAGNRQWREPSSANGYLPSLGKWVVQSPMLFGQFPAAALSYRMGLVEGSDTVVREHRSLEQLYSRAPPFIYERQGFDVNRDSRWQNEESQPMGFDFLRGRVSVTYGSDLPNVYSPQSGVTDGIVTSKTGQLRWNYRVGLAVIDAPSSQGACGFMSGDEVVTESMQLMIDNPYACVWAVAMDQKPLNRSNRILVQMGTRQFSTGWKTKPATWRSGKQKIHGREIVSFGQAPWQIESLSAVMKLKNRKLTTATTLDANGMAVGVVPILPSDNGIELQLPKANLYLILE